MNGIECVRNYECYLEMTGNFLNLNKLFWKFGMYNVWLGCSLEMLFGRSEDAILVLSFSVHHYCSKVYSNLTVSIYIYIFTSTNHLSLRILRFVWKSKKTWFIERTSRTCCLFHACKLHQFFWPLVMFLLTWLFSHHLDGVPQCDE